MTVHDSSAERWRWVRSSVTRWALVAALILLQWGLFRQHALREVVWGYPQHYDQVAYLRLAYMTYERVLEEGVAKGLSWGFMAAQPNGAMLHVLAALLFLFVGPSRLAALSLNFMFFAALQLILVWTVVWLTRRWSLALLGLGLLLCAVTPFHYAGGFMDFRIDFIAWCLYAIFICLVIRSGLFASRGFSIAAGSVAGLLALFRVITIAYLGGVFLTVAIFLAWRWRRSREPRSAAHLTVQLRGLGWAAVITAVCSIVVIATRLPVLRSYYLVGHLTGSEKHIRAAEQGVYNLRDNLLFYPTSFLRDHAGATFVAGAVLALLVALVLAFKRGARLVPTPARSLDFPGTYVFIGGCIVVPLVVLTANTAKSPVVADILVGPVLWMVLWTLALTARADGPTASARTVRMTLQILGCSALAAGLYNQLQHLAVHTVFYKQRADVRQVLELYDTIGEHSLTMGWTSPVISVDRTEQFLFVPVLDTLMYERKGVSMITQFGLGGGIFAASEREALDMARRSDFVVLSEGTAPTRSPYPFNQAMDAIRPRLRLFAEQNLMLLGHFPMYGRDRLLYVRPALGLSGDSGGWITSDGFILTSPRGAVLRRWPKVELRGLTDFARLPRMPVITAELLSGQNRRAVPATVSRSGNRYCILLDVEPQLVDPGAPTTLRISFDTYFRAKDDPRQLVIRTPTSQVLRRSDDGDSDCELAAPP